MRSARVWERRIDLSGTERLADRAHRSTYGFEERAARIKCQRSAACLASGSARVTACPYLSRQTLDIMIALKTYAGSSRYLLPSRYDADTPMSRATFNRVTYPVVELAKKEGLPLQPFTVHDLRRTDPLCSMNWVSTATGSRSALRTKTAVRRAESTTRQSTKFSAAHMMQEWSDIIDAWVAGKKRVSILIPLRCRC